jgi:hypothetical protein
VVQRDESLSSSDLKTFRPYESSLIFLLSIIQYHNIHTDVAYFLHIGIFVGFEIFTALTMKTAVILDVEPCRSYELNLRFGGTYRLHLNGRKIHE